MAEDASGDVGQNTRLACSPDPGFAQWIATSGGSLAVSTYQAAKLLIIGWNGEQISLLPRQFDKPMGLDIRGDQLVLATRHEVTIFSDDPVLARHYVHDQPGRYDALYLPRVSYHTGDLHTHDVALTEDGLVLCNTRFSCLASLSDRHSFNAVWRPPFVTDDVPEDRCHLNGLAVVDGVPGYVTCLGVSDRVGGWRDTKVNGGVLVRISDGEVVLGNLAMPHSPRWHDQSLWLLDSGRGQLLRVDPATGTSTVICELPGYLRGLTFVGPYAVVGLCKIREQKIFGGMPVQEKYSQLLCGVSVVDTRTGLTVGHFAITEGCTEIYDIRFIPGRQRVNVLNLERPEARQAFNAPKGIHYWLRPENEVNG